jgi:hypothetical protein
MMIVMAVMIVMIVMIVIIVMIVMIVMNWIWNELCLPTSFSFFFFPFFL